jgi:hypothetical protein
MHLRWQDHMCSPHHNPEPYLDQASMSPSITMINGCTHATQWSLIYSVKAVAAGQMTEFYRMFHGTQSGAILTMWSSCHGSTGFGVNPQAEGDAHRHEVALRTADEACGMRCRCRFRKVNALRIRSGVRPVCDDEGATDVDVLVQWRS